MIRKVMWSTRAAMMALVLLSAAGVQAEAQTTTPPPSQPLAFCSEEAPSTPAVTSRTLVFDGGAPESIAIVTPADSGALVTYCNANSPGWTHAFSLPASRFTIRPLGYRVAITTTNAIGSQPGDEWIVTVGMAPSKFIIKHVGQLPGD